MNNVATGGKNLQTVYAVDSARTACEIRLVSPSAPDHQHQPLFSSLAKRQRTPSYGGRAMRYRWVDDLKPWQADMLHEADAVAKQLGLPLDLFVTVNYHGTFPGGAAMASTFKAGLKRMCQWLRDHGSPVAWVYVHENPQDEKPNSHLLVHVPRRLRRSFKAKICNWFQALDGGVKAEARNDAGRRARGLGTRLNYMHKGADDLTCRRYGGRRTKGGQGPIPIKRAGVAQLLRKAAFPQVMGAAA